MEKILNGKIYLNDIKKREKLFKDFRRNCLSDINTNYLKIINKIRKISKTSKEIENVFFNLYQYTFFNNLFLYFFDYLDKTKKHLFFAKSYIQSVDKVNTDSFFSRINNIEDPNFYMIIKYLSNKERIKQTGKAEEIIFIGHNITNTLI